MTIPYGAHSIFKSDIKSINKILRSPNLTQGPKVKIFETQIAKYSNSKYAIAVNSATSALHIACLALKLNENDYLWTSAISFVASANCALYCGAKIDFIDINEDTYNICPQKLETKLKIAKLKGKLPKIIVVVHIGGYSSPMKEINKLGKKYKFKIIEDASHAIGGKYYNNKIGSCKFSDICIFSFHPVKIITTAEGGIAVTNQKNIAKYLRLFSDHGILRNNKIKNKFIGNELWNYDQIVLGYNYRMNEIQAALGISQLKKIDKLVKKRNSIAKKYNQELKGLPIKLPSVNDNIYSSFHLYIIQVNKKKDHKNLFNYLINKKIMVNLHYIPIYRHSYYQYLGFKKGLCKSSENYFKKAITLPIFPNLTNNQQKFIISSIKEFFK